MDKEERLLRWTYKEKERMDVKRQREREQLGWEERENDGRETINSSYE